MCIERVLGAGVVDLGRCISDKLFSKAAWRLGGEISSYDICICHVGAISFHVQLAISDRLVFGGVAQPHLFDPLSLVSWWYPRLGAGGWLWPLALAL